MRKALLGAGPIEVEDPRFVITPDSTVAVFLLFLRQAGRSPWTPILIRYGKRQSAARRRLARRHALRAFSFSTTTLGNPGMAEPDYTSPEFVEPQRQALLAFSKDFPFFKLLGIQVIAVEPGRARLGLAWRADLCQPMGILHGGAIASLVDTAIAHAILLTPRYLQAQAKGGSLVSVDLRIKYLRPVSSGQVVCEAHVTRLGRQIIHAAAVVTNAEGKEIAHGDSIYTIVSGRQLQQNGGY